MTDNTELTPAFNFNIESTAVGNQELVNDLLSPETASTSPEDVKIIEEEEEKSVKKPATKKEPVKKEPVKEEEEEEEETPSLQDLLMGDEEEEEEEEEEEKEKPKKETSEDGSENRFKALASDLAKLGVFTLDEDEEEIDINSDEDFLERFRLEKKKGATEVIQNFIGQFGEDYQQAFEAIFVNGVNPKSYFSTYNNIETFSNLDVTKEDNQVMILQKALTDQGFDPEDIETEIQRLRNYGDLEEVAQKHHKVLIKKEAANLEKLEKESQDKLLRKNQEKQQYLQNVNNVLQDKLKKRDFDGIPLNPKLATELQDFLVTDRYKTPSGETLTEFDRTILDLKRPENHEKKVKVALLLKVLEKDPTLSTIKKKGVSEQSNTLFQELARQTGKSSVKSKKEETKQNSWFL